MSISLAEDIRSVTDLKRHTREILDHVHQSGRPTVLTVNGRADSVIIDAKVYEKQLKAMNLARLVYEAEAQAAGTAVAAAFSVRGATPTGSRNEAATRSSSACGIRCASPSVSSARIALNSALTASKNF